MEFFDFINVIFTDPIKYKEIMKGEKHKHYFLLQRRFAIQYPLQANMLQMSKINQAAVVDFWQVFMRQQYKYVPKWLYTKGVKKSVEVKEKKQTVSNADIIEYSKYMNLDSKTVREALEFYPTQMILEIQNFQKTCK